MHSKIQLCTPIIAYKQQASILNPEKRESLVFKCTTIVHTAYNSHLSVFRSAYKA